MKTQRLLSYPVLLLALGAHGAFGAENVDSCRGLSGPGRYVLTKDLVLPPTGSAFGSCLSAAPHVTIDLNGHFILGSGEGAGISGGESVTVMNGSLRNFGTAISVGRHAHVENVVVDTAQTGVSITDGWVERSTIVNTSNFAIDFRGPSVIADNFVRNSVRGIFGPTVQTDGFSIVRDNVVLNSPENAIGLFARGGLVTGNTVRSSQRPIMTGCPTLVTENALSDGTTIKAVNNFAQCKLGENVPGQ